MSFHEPLVSSLTLNIQDVFKNNIMPKARSLVNITPLLYVVTYWVMSNTTFNELNLFIWYNDSLTITKNPLLKRKYILALRHLIDHILEVNYNIYFPSEVDHTFFHFINHSFNIYYSGMRHLTWAIRQVKEEEEQSKGELHVDIWL